MKLGIIGLSGAGKRTVFEALTKNFQTDRTGESRIGTIYVPDQRVDVLSGMYNPKKTIYAQVEYFLPGIPAHGQGKKPEQNISALVRDCDGLIHVLRNFKGFDTKGPAPFDDFLKLDQDLVFDDLVVVEKRMERIELDKKRGKKIDQQEFLLLTESLKSLENEIPLRKNSDIASAHILKGFAFVSGKPVLVLFNNEEDNDEEDDDAFPDVGNLKSREDCMVMRGKLEHELAQMSDEEAKVFLSEFNIHESAMDRVIKRSYELLGLISFFTVGEDEVRAWTVKKGIKAVDAAEVIHSDIKKGFIRAEVISYKDLMDAGTYNNAKKHGTVRLEGKNYEVCDGDIINFRFNV